MFDWKQKALSGRLFLTMIAGWCLFLVTVTFCVLLAKNWAKIDMQTLLTLFALISNIVTMVAVSYFQRADRNGSSVGEEEKPPK